MQCVLCGQTLPERAKFCLRCGARVTAPIAPPPTARLFPLAEKKKSSGLSAHGRLAAWLFLASLLALFAIIVFHSNNNRPPLNKDESSNTTSALNSNKANDVEDRSASKVVGPTERRKGKDQTGRKIKGTDKSEAGPSAVTTQLLALSSAGRSAQDTAIIVIGTDGQLSFKNLKIFPGCSSGIVSDVAGILNNGTPQPLSNKRFRITAHGFTELKNDVVLTLTFPTIALGENPFDYTFEPCSDVGALSGGSFEVSIVEEKL